MISGRGYPDISGNSLLPHIDVLRTRVAEMENVLQGVVQLAGGCPLPKLVATLKNGLAKAPSTQKLERQVASLTTEVHRLKAKLKISEEDCRRAREKANDSARALTRVEDFIGILGEVLLKAKLWDSKVGQDERISRSKVVNFITTYAAKVESALQDIRIVIGGISFALEVRGSSSDPSESTSVSQHNERTVVAKGKEIVRVETSEEPDSTPKKSDVPKSMSSVGGKEAVSALQYLSAFPTPSTHLKRSGDEKPSSSKVDGAARSGLEVVLGQPAIHALATNQQQVAVFSVVPRDHSQRLGEGLPKSPNDKTPEDFPDMQREGFPDTYMELGESAQLASIKPRQVEMNENEETGKESKHTGSIFATAAPMPP